MTLIETATAALSNNQLLVGGIGTLAFGSVMYLARAIPARIQDLIERTIWTKLYVESQSNEYRDVDQLIERCRIGFFSRSLEIKDGALVTGFGTGLGRYDGVLFKYSKSKATQQLAPFETITVSFLTRDRSVVERFMQDSRPEDHKTSINVTLFNAGGVTGSLRRRKRGLNTVFVDAAIKQRLVERFTWFMSGESWHTTRGIPWKLGVILHGPPGTGKTSLIHALASDLGLDIKYVKSLSGLGQAFMSAGKNDLFVIEDIDTISGGLTRETGRLAGRDDAGRAVEQNAFGRGSDAGAVGEVHALIGSPLHEILNAMDGMQTPDGLKFIITTNHIARLDPAIIRPGRIDDVIEVGPLSRASAEQMFRAFYGRDGIEGYAPRTGAELQQMFSTLTAVEAIAELQRTRVRPLAGIAAAE